MGLKKVKRSVSFLCLIALVMSIMLGCENSLNLKFNVKKGDKYKVVITSIQKITEDMNDKKVNVNQTMKMGYTYDISDVDKDGTATVNIKYDLVAISTDDGSKTYEYDSAKKTDSNNPQDLIYGALIGEGFTTKIDKDGAIKEISGVDKMLSNMVDKLHISDQKTRDTVLESLKKSFGDDALKQGLGSITSIYPKNQKIKLGDTWDCKQTLNVIYPITLNTKYTLKENKGDAITLAVDSIIDVDNSSSPMDLGGSLVKYALKGTQKGTMKLTKSDGFIQNGEVNQNITGTITAQDNSSQSGELSVPISMEAKTSYEVTKQ